MKLDKNLFPTVHQDMELSIMLDHLDIQPGIRTLEVGCCSEPLSSVLEHSYDCEAWAVDLKEYEYPLTHFTRGDFLKLSFPEDYFDVAIDISAMHHFGMPVPYGEYYLEDGDTQTAKLIWKYLKPGGLWYLVMDRFKGSYKEVQQFVRQYSYETFRDRVAKDFKILELLTYDVRGNRVAGGGAMEILYAKLLKE